MDTPQTYRFGGSTNYFYSVKVGEMIVGEKKLALFFDENKRLDTWLLEETTLEEN